MKCTLIAAMSLFLGCGAVTAEPDAGAADAARVDGAAPLADAGLADAALVDAAPPALSAQQMAFISNRGGDRDVWLMRLDGTGLTQVTATADDDLFASVTPDGARIAFARNGDVWAMNVNGTGLQQLTTDGQDSIDTRPAFSPDGSQIVFTSNRDGAFNIYVMNADGGSPTPVTTGADSKSFGMFNHDGTKVTYTNSTEGNVYVVNPNGTGNTSLFPSAESEAATAFSRDGTKVVFSSLRSGTWELYWGNADGSGTPQLIPTTGNELPFHASFDYNGTHVVYYAQLPGNNNRAVFISDLAGTTTTPLTDSVTSDQKIGSWVIVAP